MRLLLPERLQDKILPPLYDHHKDQMRVSTEPERIAWQNELADILCLPLRFDNKGEAYLRKNS